MNTKTKTMSDAARLMNQAVDINYLEEAITAAVRVYVARTGRKVDLRVRSKGKRNGVVGVDIEQMKVPPAILRQKLKEAAKRRTQRRGRRRPS